MEVDKTWLTQKVYAPLKLYYLERGYDLEIVDPHWAVKDLTTDDHSEVEFCIKLIEECQQTSGPINFVVSKVFTSLYHDIELLTVYGIIQNLFFIVEFPVSKIW